MAEKSYSKFRKSEVYEFKRDRKAQLKRRKKIRAKAAKLRRYLENQLAA